MQWYKINILKNDSLHWTLIHNGLSSIILSSDSTHKYDVTDGTHSYCMHKTCPKLHNYDTSVHHWNVAECTKHNVHIKITTVFVNLQLCTMWSFAIIGIFSLLSLFFNLQDPFPISSALHIATNDLQIIYKYIFLAKSLVYAHTSCQWPSISPKVDMWSDP